MSTTTLLSVEETELDASEMIWKLNNLFQPIIGFLSLAEKSASLLEAKKDIEEVKNACYEMMDFISISQVGKKSDAAQLPLDGILKCVARILGSILKIESKDDLKSRLEDTAEPVNCILVYLESGEIPEELLITKIDGEGSQFVLGAGRILVVDDEKMIRDLIETAFPDLGYEVKTCGDGAEALKLYAKNPTDIVILDLNLPGMSGTEILAQLKILNPEVKAIMITGNSNDAVLDNYAQYGLKDAIAKPFSIQILSQKVHDALAA